MNNYNDRIDHLLTNYSFEELSERDKALVRTEMSAADYTQMRVVLSATSRLNSNSIPPLSKNIRQDLKQQLRKRHAKPVNTFAMSWAPLVAGILLGIGSTLIWFWKFPTINNRNSDFSKTKTSVITDTVFIQKRDTLYLKSEPIIITKEVIKYIEKKSNNTTHPDTIAIASNSKRSNDLQPSTLDNNFNKIERAEINTVNIGASISEEKELMDLLIEMPSEDFQSSVNRE